MAALSCLALVAGPSFACSTAPSEADIDEAMDSEGDMPDDDELDESRATVNDCFVGNINFNGQCRSASFFERFVSDDAELAGISGPSSRLSDTGVIVTEIFDNGLIQNLYIDPHKYLPGEPVLSGYEYRANYRVVVRTTYSGWITAEGQSGWMETVWTKKLGPGSPFQYFGMVEWTIHTSTPSGYEEVYSDGTIFQVIALTSDQQACQAQADVTAANVAADCAISGAVAAAAAGIVAGAAVFVAMNASLLFAGPPAAAGGIATGFGTTAFFGAASYAVCNAIGAKLKAEGHQACLNPPAATAPGEFRPEATAEASDYGQDECGPGMVNYNGQASYCVDGPDGSSFADGEVVIDDNYTCLEFIAHGQCISTSAFG